MDKIECGACVKEKTEDKHGYTIVFSMDHRGDNRVKSHDSHDVVLETSDKAVFESCVIGKAYKVMLIRSDDA